MAHRTTWKDKYLGIVMQAVLLCGTINISLVFGQIATLNAPAFGSSPSSNVFVTYFGDTQSTTAIGATITLPQCQGGNIGQSNLILRLENTNTGLVLQQVGPFTSFTGFLWNTTAIATLTPSLTGSYVCRLYQNLNPVATSTLSYQLNVVVPMNLTCQYPPNLRYESLNTLSCTVTGYPLPILTWSQVNGATISPPQPPLNVSIHNVASTMSFLGNQINLTAGSNIIITTTAQFLSFSCTPLQTLTAINRCASIPRNVTVTSGPLQIVAPCPTFNDTSFSPSTPPSKEYTTQFNIACATGYTGSSTSTSVMCRANGTWTTFPTCAEIDECTSMPCQNNGNCSDHVNTFSCVCHPGYTGLTCATPTTSTNSPTTFGATTSTNSPTTFGATTSTNSPTTVGARVGSDALPSWVIPVAVVAGVLLLLLIVLFIGCYLKRSPPPGKPKLQASSKTPQLQADLTINAAYEDATTVSNAMTKSSAYELAAVPNQPNYDFIQPTQPIEYDYVTPR